MAQVLRKVKKVKDNDSRDVLEIEYLQEGGLFSSSRIVTRKVYFANTGFWKFIDNNEIAHSFDQVLLTISKIMKNQEEFIV